MDLPRMDCIWSMSSMDILSQAGFALSQNKEWDFIIPDFDGKTIVDFWAWSSDLLNVISVISNPARLIAVDTSYESSQTYNAHVKRTQENVNDSIIEVLKLMKNWQTQELTLLLNELKRRRKILVDSKKTKGIQVERFVDIQKSENVGKLDYIFLTNTFYYFKNREELLAILWMMLSDGWEIIITDYTDNEIWAGEWVKFLCDELVRETQGYRWVWFNGRNASFRISKSWAGIPYIRTQSNW